MYYTPPLTFLSLGQAFSKACGDVGQRPAARSAERETPLALEARLLFLVLFLFRKKGREKEQHKENAWGLFGKSPQTRKNFEKSFLQRFVRHI